MERSITVPSSTEENGVEHGICSGDLSKPSLSLSFRRTSFYVLPEFLKHFFDNHKNGCYQIVFRYFLQLTFYLS